jgi:hypothetical protein
MRKLNGHTKRLGQRWRQPGRRPQLEVRIGGGLEVQRQAAISAADRHSVDHLRVAAVKAFRKPEQGPQNSDYTAPVGR